MNDRTTHFPAEMKELGKKAATLADFFFKNVENPFFCLSRKSGRFLAFGAAIENTSIDIPSKQCHSQECYSSLVQLLDFF